MGLNRFKRFILYANFKKCEFFIKKVEFLNYIVLIDGVLINFNRIASIKE